MKSLKLFALVCFATLAACGGSGSSGGNPVPNPGGGGTQSYSAKIIYVGAMGGKSAQVQADLRSLDSLSSTPVMVISQVPCTPSLGQSCFGAQSTGGADVVVSPVPATTPSVAMSVDDANVVLSATPTPAPGTTPVPQATGVIAKVFAGSSSTPNVQSSGTIVANIGAPVSGAASTTVYEYVAIVADCIPQSGLGYGSGWQWNGTTWVTVSDPAQADVYVTGSRCSGKYAVPGDDGTLHFPGGGVTFSTDTPFYSLAASQWTAAETSIPASVLTTPNGDGSANAIVIAKTRDGSHIFKLFPNAMGYSAGDADYSGAVEVSGNSVDGF